MNSGDKYKNYDITRHFEAIFIEILQKLLFATFHCPYHDSICKYLARTGRVTAYKIRHYLAQRIYDLQNST